MSIDTYKLTSMDEPSDEVLSQLMRKGGEAILKQSRLFRNNKLIFRRKRNLFAEFSLPLHLII